MAPTSQRGRNLSAEDQEVEPVASRLRVRRVIGMSDRAAETFFAAEELLLAETAHRRVGCAEGVDLAEEIREAPRVGLANLVESVPLESCGRERAARIRERRVR